MRFIKYIVLHCTETEQTRSVAAIVQAWKVENGWDLPGYHLIIPANGATRRLLPDETPSYGVKGHNLNALHVSFIGGVDAHGRELDNRTPAQVAEQIRIIRHWLALHPEAQVVGHRDFLKKGEPGYKFCPSFDARAWWASVN